MHLFRSIDALLCQFITGKGVNRLLNQCDTQQSSITRNIIMTLKCCCFFLECLYILSPFLGHVESLKRDQEPVEEVQKPKDCSSQDKCETLAVLFEKP